MEGEKDMKKMRSRWMKGMGHTCGIIILLLSFSIEGQADITDIHDRGLHTYDSVNKREWLDLTETTNMSAVDALIEYNGYFHASSSDVLALFNTAGVRSAGFSYASLFTEAETTLSSYLGLTTDTGQDGNTNYRHTSSGVVSDNPLLAGHTTVHARLGEVSYGNRAPITYIDTWSELHGSNRYPRDTEGVWLYRSTESVPEPSFELLLGISLIGLVGAGTVRKIKQKKGR